MSGEVPQRLEEYINREAHEQYPATMVDAMHEYAGAALERPDRGVVVEDFRARDGAYLFARPFNPERQGGTPHGLHVVPVYGADKADTGHFGPDFYAIIDDPLTYNPNGLTYSEFLAEKLKADAGQRKVYDSQMQTMNMIRASQGKPPLTEAEFDKVLCPTENPFGRKYLSVGLVADMMKNADLQNNIDRIWSNADPAYVGLLLTTEADEAHETHAGSISTLRSELIEGLRAFKHKAPDEFAEYWSHVEQLVPLVPRLEVHGSTKQEHTLPSID
ncbi:MAG: hypothetical protein RI947_971 [Candidatus Parcubacteria bacterium]|jgi:hypothetical protein